VPNRMTQVQNKVLMSKSSVAVLERKRQELSRLGSAPCASVKDGVGDRPHANSLVEKSNPLVNNGLLLLQRPGRKG
jgi:hypothetical protein